MNNYAFTHRADISSELHFYDIPTELKVLAAQRALLRPDVTFYLRAAVEVSPALTEGAYKPLTELDRRALLQELDGHEAGTIAEGRWLDENGDECEESDEGASFYDYDDKENDLWLKTLVGMMARMRNILTQKPNT